MINPLTATGPEGMPELEPVWPLVQGLRLAPRWPAPWPLALDRLPAFPEWHDAALLRREAWPGFAAALRAVQAPADPAATRRPRPPRL